MYMELIFCAIHTPPKAQYLFQMVEQFGKTTYSLDLILTLCTLFRIYWVFRLYFFYSAWNDEKSEKICNENATFGGISFAIKCEMKDRPYRLLVLIATSTVLVLGFAIRTCEYPY